MKKYLTETERSKILELRNSNVSILNISKEIHRNRGTVAKFLKNPDDYIKEMEAYHAIAPEDRRALMSLTIKTKRSNKSQTSKSQIASLKKFLSKEEREKVISLLADGKAVTNIAAMLGRGSQTIRTFLNNKDDYDALIEKSKSEIQPVKALKLPTLLSDKDRIKVLELKQNGLPPSKIARKIRKSHESVMAFVKHPDDYEQFMSILNSTPKKQAILEFHSKINKINGINNTKSVNDTKNRFKRYLSETERSKILEMRAENTSLKTISRLIHRGASTINAFLRNPEKYCEEVEEYKKFKLIRKSKNHNSSYKTFNESLSEEDFKSFNKVSLEHRSVIKFLVKDGNTNSEEIYEKLKKVYERSAPEMNLISYWVQQFQNGRQNIVNDSRAPQRSTDDANQQSNGVLSSPIKIEYNSTGNNKKPPPVKLKLFQFKPSKSFKRIKTE